MKKSDFYFELPEELIGQTPVEPRDSSRLMVLNKREKTVSHEHFYDILSYFSHGDVIILNNSKVLPARLYGVKPSTGAKIEILLLKEIKKDTWDTLVKPAKRLKLGDEVSFGEGLLKGIVTGIGEEGSREISFTYEGRFSMLLEKIGEMPLPPYIHETLKNQSRYQTVYAEPVGSAAAPTAGLHFTPQLLEKLKGKGVEIGYITLHVGLGTFRPVKEDDIFNHRMHKEHFVLEEETVNLIKKGKERGNKVFAVGTTSVRVLESVVKTWGELKATAGETDIFIYPPYEFKVIDGLITNFHLPESSLIMLVSAFGGYEFIRKSYEIGIKEKYRFFSFGDGMLIIK